MGWLTTEESMGIRKKKKVHALYKCDWCNEPIQILEMPVVEPKGGYVSWKRKGTPKNIRAFVTKEPKETYHQVPCNYERLGKHKQLQKLKDKQKENEDMAKKAKKESKKDVKKDSKKHSKKDKKDKKSKSKSKKSVHADKGVMKDVLSLIKKKENHYTKPRLFEKFKSKHEKKDVRAALSALWAGKKIRKTDNKYYLVAA